LTYHDIEDYDAEYYKNLKWLLETDISGMDECFTFSYEEDKFGLLEVKELIENGRNIPVTEDNKFEYVQKLCYAKLYEEIKPQIEAFNAGFYEIIPQKMVTIFDHRELELVISGLPTIDSNLLFFIQSWTGKITQFMKATIQSLKSSSGSGKSLKITITMKEQSSYSLLQV
jgi:hypothetical protein